MIRDLPSFLLMMACFGVGAFALAASPNIHPNAQGLTECRKLHPERYCRIANGYPVPLLAHHSPEHSSQAPEAR